MKTRIIILAILALNLQAFCQITFEKTYGGQLSDEGFSVRQTPDEGYIAVGITYSYSTGPKVFLVRTNPNGDTLWTKAVCNGTAQDVIIDADGGFVFCGSGYTTSEDVLLVKSDTNGDTLWVKTFGGTSSDYGYALQQTADGGFIICGSTMSFGPQYQNVYLIKTDADGTLQWEKYYAGLMVSEGYSVRQTTGNDYIVSGFTSMITKTDAPLHPSFLLKVDENGDSLWMKTYSGHGAYSFAITPDNGFLICSTIGDTPMGEQDIYLIRTDAEGDTIWTTTLQLETSFNHGYWIEKTNDNNYILCGSAGAYTPAYEYDAILIKLNASGDTLWTRLYGGTLQDAVYCVQQTQDEGYILCGFTESSGSGQKDLFLIKTNENGIITSIGYPEKHTGISIYPNPAETSIVVELHSHTFQSIILLYDLKGIPQSTIHITPDQTQVAIDVSTLKSGIYLMKAMEGEKVIGVEKVVVE